MSDRKLRLAIAIVWCIPLVSCGAPPQESSELAVPPKTARVIAVAPVDRTAGEDWTSFLGPRGDGTSGETGLDPELWNPHPPLVWTKQLGTSYGGPAIIKDRLLQFDRFGGSERLSCFNVATGDEYWRWESPVQYEDMYGYNNGPRCAPLVDEGLVFVYGVAGQLSCVNLETGKPVWTKNLVDEYSVVQNFFGVASSPYVYGDLLLVMVGGSPESAKFIPPGQLSQVKPNGSAIVAFNKHTGEEVYRLGDDLASYASLSVRNINGKDVGLGFLRSGLLAWDPATGKSLFEFPWRAGMLESVNAALPVCFENQILLSETYEIGSVLLEIVDDQPKVVWKDTGNSPRKHSFRAHWSTPVLVDGFLYGCSGRNQPDSDLRCVRWSDGEVQWIDREYRYQRRRSSLLSVDGYLLVLGETGRLELIRPNPERLDLVKAVELNDIVDPRDGQPVLTYPCWSAPVLSHGLLFLRGRDKLACFDLIPPE